MTDQPINVAPGGHYFQYQGKPVLLLTTDQHYGAVIDGDFEFAAYLDYLGDQGMNLTRIYPGAFLENPDQWVAGNPLAPLAGRQVLPWQVTSQPGASPILGGYKYDLDHWNEAYFERLRAFTARARKNKIIVEIAFFNGPYNENWQSQVLYKDNNLQGIGPETPQQWTQLGNPALVLRQQAYVQEITRRLNEYDNVIFDICDEPSIMSSDAAVLTWIDVMITAFWEVENKLPNRHLLGQTVRSGSPDFSGDSRIDWLPTEYLTQADECLALDYADNKPIVLVETAYFPIWYKGDANQQVHEARVEEWEFMVGGGAGHITLDANYTRDNPTARDTLTQQALVPQKKLLREFLESFDFSRMTRNTAFSVPQAESNLHIRGIAQAGKQYALYMHHSLLDGGAYIVVAGSHQEEIELHDVPEGKYLAEWVHPETCAVLRTDRIHHDEAGDLKLVSPSYAVDIALKMIRQ